MPADARLAVGQAPVDPLVGLADLLLVRQNARAGGDAVVAVPALDVVAAGAAVDLVVAALAVNQVVAGLAVDLVFARAAKQGVVGDGFVVAGDFFGAGDFAVVVVDVADGRRFCAFGQVALAVLNVEQLVFLQHGDAWGVGGLLCGDIQDSHGGKDVEERLGIALYGEGAVVFDALQRFVDCVGFGFDEVVALQRVLDVVGLARVCDGDGPAVAGGALGVGAGALVVDTQ